MSVTSAWRRTIVTGMCRTRCEPPIWVSVMVPKRVWPSGTNVASSLMANVLSAPPPTVSVDGTAILKSLRLEVVSLHRVVPGRTLWAVRSRVIVPGISGW